MNAINLAMVCTVIYALFVLEPVRANSELCSGQSSSNRGADGNGTHPLCEANGFQVGELTQDGCRVTCRDIGWHEVVAIDRKEPSECCIRGRSSAGVCLNGLCHSSANNGQQSELSDYRKLKIKAVDLLINLNGCRPAQKLRLQVIYVKPDADRVGSYYNGEAMCTSDFEEVRQIAPSYQLVKFGFTCKTLHVHKDARIKFVAEDKIPIEKRLTLEGEDKLSELRSGPMILKCEASSVMNTLEYEIKVHPRSA